MECFIYPGKQLGGGDKLGDWGEICVMRTRYIDYNHPGKSDFEGKKSVLQSNPAILCAEFVVFQNVWLEFFFSFFRLKHAQSELKKKQSELKNTEKSYKKDKDVYDAIERSKTKLEVSEMTVWSPLALKTLIILCGSIFGDINVTWLKNS